MSKYAYHQIDANQPEIIQAFEEEGCSVSKIGRPVDLAVGKNLRTCLVEIKRPTGKLEPSQVKFLAEWKGHAVVIRTVEEARALARSL